MSDHNGAAKPLRFQRPLTWKRLQERGLCPT
jgi:hypothetical protein